MRRFLLKLIRRRTLHQDLEAELAFHREMAELHGNAIPLGNTTVLKEQALDSWRFNFAENLWRDLVWAARGLRRSPGFVASAMLSLALGIGANTAVFSIAVEFLFSEPSVREPQSLVSIRLGGSSHAKYSTIERLRESGLFREVAGNNEETFINWDDGSETRQIFAVAGTKNYFDMLGVPMAFGRGWSAADPDDVVVLSNRFWRQHLNSDPDAAGRTIRLDGRAYTITGILPDGHRTLLGFGFAPDLYVPQFVDGTLLAIYARSKPDMSTGEIQAAVRVIAERIDVEYPERFKLASGIEVARLTGDDRLKGQKTGVALFFAVLLTLTGLVLLIACVNVASLLLARASVRRQEIAIRLSLGASRARLLQQLLAESLMIAVLGAAGGFALAQVVAQSLASIRLPLPLPFALNVDPDWRVAAYTACVTVAVTLLSGLAPAFEALRESLNGGLRRERRLGFRRALVGAQIAVSAIVLSAGFLFVHNLVRSAAISPGFDVTNTLRADVHLPPAAYRDGIRKSLYIERALSELSALPGIEAVGAARVIPFTDSTRFGADLTLLQTGEKKHAQFHWNAVSSGYFRAMGIPLLAGRAFTDREPAAEKAVIVNRTFVERYLGNSNGPGATFLWGDGPMVYRVVGVAGNTRNMTIGEEDRPQLYQPLSQIVNSRTRIQFVLRSANSPGSQIAAVKEAVRRVEPAAGIEVRTMYSSIGLAFLPSQIGAAMAGSAGVIGLLLAAIGLYGVMSFSVAQRTREIGIRMAVGAGAAQVMGMVLRDAVRMVGAGAGVGIAIALLAMRPLAMFLSPGLSPGDPVSLAAVVGVLGVAAAVAVVGPVRRAVGVDPMRSLRHE